jgi:hypothetical protein
MSSLEKLPAERPYFRTKKPYFFSHVTRPIHHTTHVNPFANTATPPPPPPKIMFCSCVSQE